MSSQVEALRPAALMRRGVVAQHIRYVAAQATRLPKGMHYS